jgi:hypothetical protein
VTPAVIKIQLASLEETGRVVGRLSALSTAGAIVGTFLTGFLLVAAFPTRPVVRVTALLLVLLGIGTAVALRRRRSLNAGAAVAVLAAGAFSFAAPHPCEYESAYYCAYVVADEEREAGRALWLDTLRHSYVDLEDPTYLEFTYTQWFGDVIAAIAPEGEPLSTLHLGGAGFTMPRYLRAVHPGSTSQVLEVDPFLVELAQDELGLELGDDITVLVGDARSTITTFPREPRPGHRRRLRRRRRPLAPGHRRVHAPGGAAAATRRGLHDERDRLRPAIVPAGRAGHRRRGVRPRRGARPARLLR